MIMEFIDNNITEDRRRKYSNALIVKILVILQIYGISYRSAENFFRNHPDIKNDLGLENIPNFRTLSRRARMIDWHKINNEILKSINTYKENSAIDSFIVKTCKSSTASRRKNYGNYKDPLSSWGFSTKGWQYGRKISISLDIDSSAILEWNVTTASLHDKNMAFPLIDSVRNYSYLLMDAAYDSSDIYEYIFENTDCIPVIDTNKRRGIVESRLSESRRKGLEIRKKEASRYSLRWEIERTFAILEDILDSEYIWYVRNRNYDVSVGIKMVAYNIIILLNQMFDRPKRKIMDIVI
ncbi:MAG: transposase [Caldisericum sp.]|uniref:transposase n=1 Tax=Caldisericum sp. TaxID=2499687 RepID=UPI003D0BC68F